MELNVVRGTHGHEAEEHKHKDVAQSALRQRGGVEEAEHKTQSSDKEHLQPNYNKNNKLYDPDFEFCREKVLPESFHRFTGDFSGEPFAEYTVRSIDIDFEGHMNNVAYIRALFGLFSRAELEKMDPKEIEFQYKVSCYEGDRLFWYKRSGEDGLELCARLENGTDIFLRVFAEKGIL